MPDFPFLYDQVPADCCSVLSDPLPLTGSGVAVLCEGAMPPMLAMWKERSVGGRRKGERGGSSGMRETASLRSGGRTREGFVAPWWFGRSAF